MSSKRYAEAFKLEAVKQVIEYGQSVPDVAARLNVSPPTLYAWLRRYGVPMHARQTHDQQQAELRRLHAELKRVTEDHDILKKAAAYFANQFG